ncbi:acyl-CoA carboxylase subunit epsilon [Streptomyces sp. NBC_00656]|uniref:acyl-CoA carboxylase subunit epsilon n=1 Tax=Streptomyces sp. NBC_00656 TaxID=2903668 RepID=UPI0032524A52
MTPGRNTFEDQTSATAAKPLLTIRGGSASPEEVAAVIAACVLLRPAVAEPVAHPTGDWASPDRLLRTPRLPGPGAWRASARLR